MVVFLQWPGAAVYVRPVPSKRRRGDVFRAQLLPLRNNAPPAYDFGWVHNFDYSYSSGVPFVTYGDDYACRMHVQGSDNGFNIAPVVQLTPFDYSYDSGRRCWDYLWEGTGHGCSRSSYSNDRRSGSVYRTTAVVP